MKKHREWNSRVRLLKKLLRIMKLTSFLLLVFVVSVSASVGYSQSTKLNLHVENASLKDILKQIENQSEFYFYYNNDEISKLKDVSIEVNGMKIEDVLTRLLTGTNLEYRIIDRYIALKTKEGNFSYPTDFQQQKSISGKVTDPTGSGLPGVSVVVKGSTNGTITDANGNYSLANVPENATLQLSFVGMKAQEISVAGKSILNIVMEEDSIGLDEVIAIGYGTTKKSDLTGSISSINQDTYKEQPVNRIDQILQGRSAGVSVVNSSGAPGGASTIRIRGANSINGNNDPLYVIDGFVGADFKDVNPIDIESIQVLKDASSTAIYGSRGANGVVLITTKSGVAGKSKFSLTTRYITSETLGKWDLMDAGTFAETANTRAAAMGLSALFSASQIADFKANGGTNWQDEMLRRAGGQEIQLDYSGGNDKLTYFVSGNYLDQEGIIINSDYKRYSLRTNVSAKITEKLKTNIKMNFARRENNNTNGDGNTSGALAGALAWAPTTPVNDANGKLTIRDPFGSIKGNPVEIALDDNINESNVFNANGSISYDILPGLIAEVGFGMSYGNVQGKAFSLGQISTNPTARRQSDERIFLQNTNSLTYTKVINGIHRITATGVFENQFLQNDRFLVNAGGLQFPDLKYDNITLAKSLSAEALKTKETILSYIGRINYSLMEKYLLTASVRTDGSSKFRGSNRYGTFPSVGLGWRLSEEPFVRDLGVFDNLKLRTSWGQTGSQAIPVYGTVTTFNTDPSAAGTSFENGQQTAGIIIGNPGNANLSWETTEQINVGFDVSVLKGRLSAEIDYFKKKTTDLLLSEPLPQYSGGGNIYRNLGATDNSGFEFTLNGTIIKNKNLEWNSSINASFLSNEVKNIGDRTQMFLDGDAGAGMTNLPEMVIMPGYSLSNYWGLKYLGVWQTSEATDAAKFGNVPGDSKYQDLNKDGVIGGADYQIIGSGLPTGIFGWNNTVDYKQFTLNVFFQSMIGFDKWNFTYAQSMIGGSDARQITNVDILNRWSPTNQSSNIPAFSPTDVAEVQSSRFMEKGDYVRLKNISLSYNLPKDFIRGIKGSVTISGSNLLTITNYTGIDPETLSNRGPSDARGADAGSYPNAKTWTMGINLIF